MARLDLPRDKKELSEALDLEMEPAEQEANVHLTSWRIVDAYLAGVRKFQVVDRLAANLALSFENILGGLEMRWEEVVRLYLGEVGRFLKMAVDPVGGRKGESIGALREGAIAHAVLGGLSQKLPLEMLRRQVVIPFIKHGTVGLSHVDTGDPDMPDMVEVVPGRQLRGMPAWVDGVNNLYAIARKRWVPLGWAKDRVKTLWNKRLPMDNVEEVLRAREVPWGSVPPEHSASGIGEPAGGEFLVNARTLLDRVHLMSDDRREWEGDMRKKDGRLYVPLEEIHVYDDTQQFVSRFIVRVGTVVVQDEDFEKVGSKVICPLHVARHTDIGKMFARGYVAPLMPMNDQVERMLRTLFKNMQEMDQFGTLFVTGGMGVDLKKWTTGPRPKIQKYEPDPLEPRIEPKNLTPANTGLAPVRVAEFAQGQMERLSGQGPAFRGEATGRVDSAAGLGFLFNTANIGLALPAEGLADAWAGVYRRMLQAAQERAQPGEMVELAVIDDAIAGVVVDPTTGLMGLAENPIPDAWRVKVDIKDRTPRDREVRKRELLELFGAGLVTQTRFWITALEENLDFPGSPKDLWETWRKAVWQIILLFKDGETPGTVQIGEHVQNPDVQLIAVQTFMNKIEFSLASEAVRRAFETWKVDLEIAAGQRFPAGLGPPEEIAAMQAAGGQQRSGIPQAGIPQGMAPPGILAG